jgi:hypothetical protein
LTFGKVVGFGARALHIAKLPKTESVFNIELSCTSTATCVVGADLYNFSGAEVLATSNGGGMWKVHQLPGATSFDGPFGLSCAGSGYCVAAGTSVAPGATGPGPFLAATTSDEGETWSVSPIASLDTFGGQGLSCPTAGTCFLGSVDEVLKRAPGQAAWTAESIASGPGPLAAVACPTSTTCIALGREVVERSADGGLIWTQSPNDLHLATIACPTNTHCVATGSQSTTGEPVLYQSSDAGATWEAATETALSAPHAGYGAVTCTLTTCIATANDPTPLLVRTTDGGATWSLSTSPTGFDDLSCGSTTTCVAFAWNGATNASSVYVTSNAGVSWIASQVPTIFGSVSCSSPAKCLASASDSYPSYDGPNYFGPTLIYESQDGGLSWSQLSSISTSDGPGDLTCAVTVCQLLDSEQWPATTQTVETSVDGGTDWSVALLPDEPSSLGEVAISPSGTWVLVGGDSLNGALVATSP